VGSRQDLADLLACWRADRMAFRREAILLEDGRPFGEAVDAWQADDFRALDDPQYRHGYLERPRGHSKTGDLGTEAVTELVLGPSGQRLYCTAADEDQAGLLLADVVGKFQRSPLLAPLIKITRTSVTVKATGSTLTVLAADAPSAYGLRPDWIAVDELAEWRKRDLWDSLWSATGKRPRCRMLVISSAGWDRTSIAWEARRVAETEADWYFSPRGQCASWISPAWLAQQARSLPRHVYQRLHESRWVEGVGAFLTSAEVDAIFVEVLPAEAA
jgi:terminase large subunit-like protein